MGYFYKYTCYSIDQSLNCFLLLWGFLCVRDAGHRGNKITAKWGIRTFRTHGRFVPRRFVPKVEMIRTQSLNDSYPKLRWFVPNCLFDNKTFLIISLSKQSKISIYINQTDSLPTRQLDQITTTAHFLCVDSWRVSGADTKDFSLTYNSKGNGAYTKLACSHFSRLCPIYMSMFELVESLTTAHFLCVDSWCVSGADTRGGETLNYENTLFTT